MRVLHMLKFLFEECVCVCVGGGGDIIKKNVGLQVSECSTGWVHVALYSSQFRVDNCNLP